MGTADNQSVAAHAKSLDELWKRADRLFTNSRANRSEIDKVVVEMTDHLDELLECKLYPTDRERATEYAEFEALMVKTIGRVMRLRYSTGTIYRTRFFKQRQRSPRAEYLLKWHGAYARLTTYFDASRR